MERADGGSTAAFRRPYAFALRICLLYVVASFATEVNALWAAGLGSAGALGLLGGLGLAAVVAVPLSLAFGAVLEILGAGVPSPKAGPRPSWLFERDPGRQVPRVAAVSAVCVLSAVALPCALVVTRKLILSFAQPHFAAVAVVGAHVLLLALVLFAFPPLRRACVPLAELGQHPSVRPVFGRAGGLVLLLCALAVGAAVAVLAAYWSVFVYLPWRTLGATVGALALVVAWQAFGKALGRAGQSFELVALALALTAGIGALVLAGDGAQESRRALRDSFVGDVAYRVTVLVLDFDRDGSLQVLGGGDCAPFDASRSPLAIDVPGNRIDEDCDGSDLDERMLGRQVAQSFPVPEGVPDKPPLLLITVDAFAAKHMKAFGYPRSVTPHMDAFARRGTLFVNAFAQGPSTRLSFPALFSSRYDTQIAQRLIGNHPFPIEDSELMLAEVLAQAGYDTAAVVSDSYFRRSRWGSLTQGFKSVVESPIKRAGSHNSAQVTDAALAVLDKPRKKPLFLWVHYYDAHSPHAQPAGIERFGKERRDQYDAELKLVDREVGRLLANVESRFAGRAYVVLTGDHGIAFDQARHGRFNYGYDLTTSVLHVPLIVAGPLVLRQTLDSIVSTMDVAPTLTNLLSRKRTPRFEGASLVPELFNGQPSRPPRLLHQFYLQERLWEEGEPLEQISLRTDRYNLIHDRKLGAYALYDYRADYWERRNLIDDPRYQRELLALKQQLALMTYRVYERARPKAQRTVKGPATTASR